MEGVNNNLHYYLYDEICLHNKRDDFWVVIHDHVFNLTIMLKDRIDTWNSVEYNQSIFLFFIFNQSSIKTTIIYFLYVI